MAPAIAITLLIIILFHLKQLLLQFLYNFHNFNIILKQLLLQFLYDLHNFNTTLYCCNSFMIFWHLLLPFLHYDLMVHVIAMLWPYWNYQCHSFIMRLWHLPSPFYPYFTSLAFPFFSTWSLLCLLQLCQHDITVPAFGIPLKRSGQEIHCCLSSAVSIFEAKWLWIFLTLGLINKICPRTG